MNEGDHRKSLGIEGDGYQNRGGTGSSRGPTNHVTNFFSKPGDPADLSRVQNDLLSKPSLQEVAEGLGKNRAVPDSEWDQPVSAVCKGLGEARLSLAASIHPQRASLHLYLFFVNYA